LNLFSKQAAPLLLLVSLATAQTPSKPETTGAPFDETTAAELTTQSAALLRQAQSSANGLASVTLQKYPGHLTMLTARTKAGGAEQHNHWTDIFIVLDGEARVVVGGTIEDAKQTSPGEIRGTRVVGGTEHIMRKGDVVHISPGLPHQTIVAPGRSFTYYVIKVAEPGAAAS
jgi:mannose-6-phosphate isomerase-like protein (cupin superfamily)